MQGTSKLDGATVDSITPGAPAADADLKVGDVIRKVDGKPVTGSIDLVVAIRTHVPGEKVTLTVERKGKTFEVKVGPRRQDRLRAQVSGSRSFCDLQRRQRAQRLGDHDRVVALHQPEVAAGLTWERPLRPMASRVAECSPRSRADSSSTERPMNVVGQRDPVELGPLAAGDDVGDDLGQPGVERGAGEQP